MRWRPISFIVLGAACRDGYGDEGIALPVRAPRGPEAMRRQWAEAVDGAGGLGLRVLTLVERRLKIGTAQKEAVLKIQDQTKNTE